MLLLDGQNYECDSKLKKETNCQQPEQVKLLFLWFQVVWGISQTLTWDLYLCRYVVNTNPCETLGHNVHTNLAWAFLISVVDSSYASLAASSFQFFSLSVKE